MNEELVERNAHDNDEDDSTSDIRDAGADVKDQLVDWKNPPKLAQLKEDLLAAQPIHFSQMAKIDEWLDNLHVRGKALVKTGANNSKIVPKLIRKQAEWRYASLSEPFLSVENIFNVKPRTFEDKAAADQNQLLLNYQFNTHVDKVRFIDEYVRAAVDEGTVVLRTGWEFIEEKYEAEEPGFEMVEDPAYMPMHQHLAQMRQQAPDQYDAEVPDELKTAHQQYQETGTALRPNSITRKVIKTRTVCNRPTVEVCNIHNVVIDPTAKGDIDKASFVCYHWETSLAKLKKDGRYKNLDDIQPEQVSVLASPDHASVTASTGFNFNDEPRKVIVVYEYQGFWDIDGNGLVKPIIAAWAGETLIRLEEAPWPDKKLPYVLVPYLVKRAQNYGEPDGALLDDNQKVIGAVTRGMIDIMGKSANGQTGTAKSFLDATNQRKFDRGEDYQFNPNMDPRLNVFMHTFPEIPASAQFMLQQQAMEAESLTGVKSFNQGVTGASLGDVAAGVRGALDASSKRELGILRRLADGIVKVGHKFIAMNAVFLSDQEVVRVTNDQFVPIQRDDLPGNFDLILGITTAEEDNAKANELAFMLQTLGPNEDPAIRRMVLSEIAKLRKMPDLAKKFIDYKPEPDPMQQQKMMLEMELLKAQVAQLTGQSQNQQATAQLNVAKIEETQAQAAKLRAEADRSSLDFVEQESGVNHAREMEHSQAQAHAQAQTKIVAAGLDMQKAKQKNQTDLLKEYLKIKHKAA